MSTNSNKLVHVKAYTKSDGTEVREHYRGGVASNDFLDNIQLPKGPLDVDFIPFPEDEVPDVLQGRVEKSDYPSDDAPSEEQGSVKGKAQEILKGIEIAASILAELTKNLGKRKLTTSQLNSSLYEIEKGQQKAIIRQNLMLDYLTNTTNKQDYTRAYKQYMKLRSLIQENENLLSRIKYTVPRYGIESVTSELDNLNTNFDEISKIIREMNPLSINNKTITTRELPKYESAPNAKAWQNNIRDFSRMSAISTTNYNIPKGFVDVGMNYYNRNNSMPDAAAMWEAAAHDFIQSKDYVTKNGSLVYNINNLPSVELQNIVQQKVEGQMGVTNAPGLIFKSGSNLAKEIAVSPELKKYFLDNRDKLLNREVVKGGSTLFTSSKNLANSLGHADFVYTYIDTEGNLCSVVLDTYDFNKSDTDWKVQIANMAQELGTIRNYYVLIIVKTPEYIWKNW